MQTIVGVNSSIAVKRFAAALFIDNAGESYWEGRFIGQGKTASMPVQLLTELESDAGDKVSYDLFGKLKQKPTYGDTRIDGKAEPLSNFSDIVYIDQVRCQVSGGGRMSRKRTLHDLRMIAKKQMSLWWAMWSDEVRFMYAAGARGVNSDFIEDTTYTGYAGNPFTAPDVYHLMYGGVATAQNNLQSTDVFSLSLIDKAVVKAETMGSAIDGKQKLQPIMVDGEKRYVCLMHEYQFYNLKTNTATGQWLDIQKAATTQQGQKNPIFVGGQGMYNGVVLHKHFSVIRFGNYGAGANIGAARAQFMGAQAMVEAYGSPGSGMRLDWHEEMKDAGNEVVITSSAIKGQKKTTFNSLDYGMLSLDTAATNPNPN